MLQHTCAAQGRKWFRATWGGAIHLCERKSLNSSTRSLSSYRTFNRAVFSASYSVSLRMAEVAKFRYCRDKVVGPCVQRAVAAVQYLQQLLLVAAQRFLTSVLQLAGKFMTWLQMLADSLLSSAQGGLWCADVLAWVSSAPMSTSVHSQAGGFHCSASLQCSVHQRQGQEGNAAVTWFGWLLSITQTAATCFAWWIGRYWGEGNAETYWLSLRAPNFVNTSYFTSKWKQW